MNRILTLVLQYTQFMLKIQLLRNGLHFVPDATVILQAACHVAHTPREGQPVHIPVSGVSLNLK